MYWIGSTMMVTMSQAIYAGPPPHKIKTIAGTTKESLGREKLIH
jgi:hypothetical protein